jgi:hypothetical protein
VNLPLTNPESYPLSEEEGEGLIFHTDAGAEYLIYSKLASEYMPGRSFSHLLRFFGFSRRYGWHIGKDPRIAATVGGVLRTSLDEGLIVIYVCDQGDGKQRGRHQLFNDWIERSIDGIVKLNHHVENEFFASLMYSHDHPFRHDIEQDYQNSIALSAKTNPDHKEIRHLFAYFLNQHSLNVSFCLIKPSVGNKMIH